MLIAALVALSLVQPVPAPAPTPTSVGKPVPGVKGPTLDAAHMELLTRISSKASVYLRSKQDKPTGAWGVKDGVAPFPAITALALSGLLDEPGVKQDDPVIAAAVGALLKAQQPDGSIQGGALPSYNTAISIAALAKVSDPKAKEAVAKAVAYLKSIQYGSGVELPAGTAEAPTPVGKEHSFYGGWGYGKHGRPDLSNTQWALEGLHAAGVGPDDASFQRALIFLQRCQMVDSVNEMSYADGSTQGGFIYATSENKDNVGIGQSFAGTIEETMDDGKKVSRLRCYGSMTYAGFKSYLYAGLKADDPRVIHAKEWMSAHYTLDENPGVGTDGLFYYYVTMARSLAASGEPTLPVKTDSASPRQANWAQDLIAKLASLQQEDGSFKPVDDRWMENDPVLITAYSLMALRSATPTKP